MIISTCCSSSYLQSRLVFKSTSSYQCCVDKQQHQLKEMVLLSKVSRRLAMNLVGFNSLLLHACPCHGASQLFGYSGPTGPDKWGSLSPSYKTCGDGKMQSPIDIAMKDIVPGPELGPLTVRYNNASATMINRGFNVELEYGNDVGGAFIDGKMYNLNKMHWHSPSEHTIDGIRYAAELHLVHTAADGSTSVVAIIYKYGSPDPLLSQFKDHFVQLANGSSGLGKTDIPIENVRTTDIIQTTKDYFRYGGSLTAPPCTEKVIWNVLREVREISVEQVATLKAPLHELCKNNSRPIQPLNGRRVKIPGAPLI